MSTTFILQLDTIDSIRITPQKCKLVKFEATWGLHKQSGTNSSSLQGKKKKLLLSSISKSLFCHRTAWFFLSCDLAFSPDVRMNPFRHSGSQVWCVPPGGTGGCLKGELEGAGSSCSKAWPASLMPWTHFTFLCPQPGDARLLSSDPRMIHTFTTPDETQLIF